MPNDAQIVIVGAGPAGALLAYLLSSRGIDTLLLERQSDFNREFRGEVLTPSGVRALEQSGFSLDRISTRVPDVFDAFMNGERFASFRLDDPSATYPTVVSQPELLEELVSMSQRTGHFEFQRGVTVRSVARRAEGGVRLSVRGADGGDTIDAPFLIGADGRGSVVRRSLAPPVESRSAPLDVVWFKLPYPEAWTETRIRFEAGHGHLMIAAQSTDRALQVAWVILKGTYGELKKRSVPEWIDAMRPYADPELRDHFAEYRDSSTRPFLLNAVSDRVKGWAGQDTLLIGDAAHTMSPVGGQGINVALRDVVVAANLLVRSFHDGLNWNEAASKVERIRAPEVDRIQRVQAIPPRLIMGRTQAHEWARGMLARVAGSNFAQRRAGPLFSQFLDGVTEVTLEV